jgi:hypothetical protein
MRTNILAPNAHDIQDELGVTLQPVYSRTSAAIWECETSLSMQAKFPLMEICHQDGSEWFKTWPIVQIEKDKAMEETVESCSLDMFNLGK